MNLQPNTTLERGKYKILSLLGQGGFGVTYLGEQVGLGRKVAIKEFFMKEYCERNNDSQTITVPTVANRDIVDRFRSKFIKEARSIAKFKNHNIVSIIDIFEENGTAYYIMDYIENGSLSSLLEKHGALSESEAVKYIRQVSSALAYVHARSIMHLDVKPANIMLDDEDNAILIDFGLAKQYDISGEQTSTTPVGISHGYAPMEQYKRGGVSQFSPATDIYSLGATLYKLVTGSTPPEASDIYDDGLPSLPGHLSTSTRAAIEAAMQPRRKERPQSIAEFLAILDGGNPIIENDDTTIVPETKNDSEETKIVNKQSLNDNTIITDNCIDVDSKTISIEEQKKESARISKLLHSKYDYVGSFFDGYAIVEKYGKYGFVNSAGIEVISPIYSFAYPFSDNLACVKYQGKWGYINKEGTDVIPMIYNEAGSFLNGVAAVKINSSWFEINKDGERVD